MDTNRNRRETGFTLIELAIVVLIIGILSSIAIPHFLGMQKKARARVITESCATIQRELHHWMAAVATSEQQMVDFNGDGALDAADEAVRPADLAAIPASWDNLHALGGTLESRSPYSSNTDLYNMVAAAGSGQIAISCVNQACRIRGFTDRAADGAIYDRQVCTE